MAGDQLFRPRLRAVEILPAQGPQGQVYLLRDPLGVAAEDAAVPAPALFLMQFMDGTRDAAELAAEFHRQTGQGVGIDQVERLSRQLEEKNLLEGERFEQALTAKVEAYRQAPRRESILAGQGLPAERGEAAAELDRILADRPAPEQEPAGPAAGLVAPHIDLARGRRGYALAYGWLAGQPRPDRVIILGTSHNGATRPLIPTDKPFRTPLGEAAADRPFLARIEGCLDAEARRFEFLHLREHSLEFQVLFLQHLALEEPPPLVPLMTGPLPVGPEGSPGGTDEVEELVATLTRAMVEAGGRTLVIAGADLAHLGPDFGDEEPVDAEVLAQLEEEDRESLRLAAAGEAEAFYRQVAAGDNPRRVCGLAPIYLLLRLLPGRRGTLLGYEQAVAEEGRQCVSFAALAFTGGE